MPGRKKIKKKISIVAFLVGIIAIFAFYSYQKTQKKSPERILVSSVAQKLLLESATQIRDWYYQGDWDEHFKDEKSACPLLLADKSVADIFYYRCNPHFLECIFESKKGLLKTEKPYTVRAVKNKQGRFTSFLGKQADRGSLTPNNSLNIKISVPETGHYLNFSLENDCHDVYLPKRVYSYFRKTSDIENLGPKNQFLWDNFNSRIFIDKFQVRWRDIADWLRVDKFLKIQGFPEDIKRLHEAATSLSKIQMEEYCAFRGKQLLPAHYFDAATVLPGNMDNSKDFYLKHYYYPWTIREKDSFVYKYANDKNLDFTFTKKSCSRVYSKECQKKFNLNIWATGFSSWTELRQILGGNMEYLRNPRMKEQNLKVSSFSFPLDSEWHKLGVRGYWDSEKIIWSYPDGKRGRVRYLPPEGDQNPGIGFRCMKYMK